MRKINKIIHLKDRQDNLVNFIKDLLDKAEKGEITQLMTASDDNIGNDGIMTGYYNCDFFTRHMFLVAMQLDLNYKMIESNVDNLIEFVEE